MERAILEVLYLVPQKQGLEECRYLIEGLRTLRPKLLQTLLENCTSIKVNRLFLLFAEHLQLPCLQFLDIEKVNLGSGNRHLVANGKLDKKYLLTIPKNLFDDET